MERVFGAGICSTLNGATRIIKCIEEPDGIEKSLTLQGKEVSERDTSIRPLNQASQRTLFDSTGKRYDELVWLVASAVPLVQKLRAGGSALIWPMPGRIRAPDVNLSADVQSAAAL